MVDRAQQALYLLALEPVAETTADPNSYGFRSARSTADAIEQCFRALARPDSAAWILEADIRSCFDEISHDWLVAHIPTDKAILRRWLKAGYLHNRVLHSTEAGTPQGGIISPTLMNMTLDGMERALRKRYCRGNNNPLKVNIVRYADDFIITGATREVLVDEVRPTGRAVSGGTGLIAIARKDPDHAHRRWVRFPRHERAQVWRQAVDQACQSKRSALPAQAAGNRERQCNDAA